MALSLVQADPIPVLEDRAPKGSSLNNKATCKTPQCVTAAKEILEDMNPKADPCKDFSQFACGGFYEKKTIAADQSTFNYFQVIHDKNNRVIREILDPTLGKSPKPAPLNFAAKANLQKLQDLYASCMDESALLKAGRKPLIDQISSILSAFPPASNSTTAAVDKTVLAKTLAQLSNQGVSSFVHLDVGPDSINPLVNSLSLSEGGLGLPAREYYQDVETIKLYESTISQMFQIVFGEEDIATRNHTLTDADVTQQSKDAAKAVVDFETQLAAIGTDLVDLYDPIKSNNPLTVAQISEKVPTIDWPALVSGVLPTGVTNTRPITVFSPSYLTHLETLLEKTPPQTLRNYISWLVISNSATHLGFPYRQPLHNLNAGLSGISPDIYTQRWETCVGVINNNLGDLAGHYYINEAFPRNSRASVLSIVDSLLDAYSKTFPTLKWLDNPTLAGAMQKLSAIVKLMGYSTDSPNVASSKSLQKFFSTLPVSRSDYYANQLQHSIWAARKSAGELNKPVNRKMMSDPPQTHGFDNMGHHYDPIGRIHNWWTNATEKAFNEKAQCFVDQYGNFTVKGPDGKDHHVNGQLTLGENIADNGGIKQSFRAWQSRLKSDPSGKKYKNFQLPGLERYSPSQMFFISYARLWCSKERPEYLMNLIRSDSHSPAQWRINGVAQNSPEFAQAFKCPVGAPMNPVKKCQVW
ncbi:hypothetical protein BGZ96_011524 [Linnemannia gamsii]|uniref:Zincin n=1 Tax=Linnemannia gamsii TaxID=64522 RepID=A0ABQ7JSW3_9FUNG|nr:hypothetical protein BGZ96_011524 [Linnemannia gamsii]